MWSLVILIGRGLDLSELGVRNEELRKRRPRGGSGRDEAKTNDSDGRRFVRKNVEASREVSLGRANGTKADLCGFEGAKPGAASGAEARVEARGSKRVWALPNFR